MCCRAGRQEEEEAGEGKVNMAVLTSSGMTGTRASIGFAADFDLIISVVRVGIKGIPQVDLNHLLLNLQPIAGGPQHGRLDALGVQWLGAGEPVMLE